MSTLSPGKSFPLHRQYGVEAPRAVNPHVLETALICRQIGLPVFPMHRLVNGRCTCTHRCKEPGSHPVGSASKMRKIRKQLMRPSIKTIHRWWERYPYAQIGIETGSMSGIVALHIYHEEGGEEALQELERQHGALPATMEVMRGAHAYLLFEHPGHPIPKIVSVGQGLSMHGDAGCFAMAPGARIRNSRTWQLLQTNGEGGKGLEAREGQEGEVKPARLPAWLLALAARGVNAPTPEAIHEEIPTGLRRPDERVAETLERTGALKFPGLPLLPYELTITISAGKLEIRIAGDAGGDSGGDSDGGGDDGGYSNVGDGDPYRRKSRVTKLEIVLQD